jgi:hypothetical protein
MDPVYTNEYFVTKPSTDFFNAIGGFRTFPGTRSGDKVAPGAVIAVKAI